ncbi:hypothetical protein AB0C38_31925 [Amycolatopsis sp. NPDC048633]|uniref:hypothetical protein n=1 Tax=Amycolatopsis sp. NPDC048633 TaxID=3157095 RepID=UPI0033EB2E52
MITVVLLRDHYQPATLELPDDEPPAVLRIPTTEGTNTFNTDQGTFTKPRPGTAVYDYSRESDDRGRPVYIHRYTEATP